MTHSSPTADRSNKRFKLIACEIAFREVCLLAAHCRNIIDPIFLRKGLHDVETREMVAELQQTIDAVDATHYEAILLGYGRCNNGVAGLCARSLPLVIPRAHDCITFFLGSKEQYRNYFDSHPGTYFRTSGWIERSFTGDEEGVMHRLGLDRTREQYAAEYGEENADYIMEVLGSWEQSYDRLAFIETGVADQLDYGEQTRREAEQRGWQFDRVPGRLDVLRRLLEGQWDPESFVVVPPGHAIAVRNDELILDVCPDPGAPPKD